MVGRSFAGVLLVAIGIALLVINLTGVGGVAIVLLGGLAFLATHLATRTYGFLVPGGILTGLGAALVLQDLGVVTDVAQIGLGAGFLLIPAVQLLTGQERQGGWWWPLIPGGILTLLGVLERLQGDAAGLVLPAALIILGLAFLLSAARRGSSGSLEDRPGSDVDTGQDLAAGAPEPEDPAAR